VALAAVVLSTVVGLATVHLYSFQHQLKAFLIVVAAVTMVTAALKPRLGLALLLGLSPFALSVYGTNTDQFLLIALTLVLVWRIQLRAIPGWAWIGVLALVGGSFISAIAAHSAGDALEGALNWLTASVMLLAAFGLLRDDREAARKAVEVFVGCSLIVVLFGVLQKRGVTAIVDAPWDGTHPNSFFGYYTVYAGYIALSATLATGEVLIALENRRRVRALLFGGALVMLLLGLAETDSRGGIVALGAGWLVLLILNVNRASLLGRALVLLALIGAIGYVIVPHSTIVTLEQRFKASNGSLGEDQTRFAIQSAGEHALAHHPFGLGYANFPFYVRSSVHNGKVNLPFFHAQETFVQMGLDTGWIGLGGFLTLLAAPLALIFKKRRRTSSAVRATAFAAAIGGFCAQGLYDYFFWQLQFVIFFMFMIWGLYHSIRVDTQSSPREPELHGPIRVARTRGPVPHL
jgi:hypothetical protein